jgi:hypothetical protein
MVSFSALLLPPAAAQAADPRCVIRSAIAEAHTPAVIWVIEDHRAVPAI